MRISSSSSYSLFLLPGRRRSSGRGSVRFWAQGQRGSVCPNSAITQLSSAASSRAALCHQRLGRGGVGALATGWSRVYERGRESTARNRPQLSAVREGKQGRGQTAAAVPSPPVPAWGCAPGYSVSALSFSLSKGLHAHSDLSTFIPCSAGW